MLIALAPLMSRAQSCEYGNWSAPNMVGQRVVARDPSVTRVGDRMYFAGSNTRRFDSLPPADSVLTLLDREGTPLPRPAGRDVFMLPRVARLTDSAFVMMWGEPDSVPTDRRQPPWTNVGRLWAATWDRRRGWTEAHPLLAGVPIAWTEEAVSGPVMSDGDVLLAIPHRKGLQYLQYHEGVWREVLIPLASSTEYASIATDPRPRAFSSPISRPCRTRWRTPTVCLSSALVMEECRGRPRRWSADRGVPLHSM
jgi:hypothetical protein